MKIPSGKGLMFYFGGINIMDACMRDQKLEDEDSPVLLSVVQDMIKKSRMKVIGKLNKHADLSNVSDLFAKATGDIPFNPIVADIRIPLSLQKKEYVFEESRRSKVERFKVVYDGEFLIVGAMCPLDKRPYGVYDVRDRFEEIMESIYEFESIPPCLTHYAMIFVRKGERYSKEAPDVCLETPPSSTFMDITVDLYLRLHHGMHILYDVSDTRRRIETSSSDINKDVSKLIADLGSFLNSSWKDIRKKRKLLKEARDRMLKILTGLAEYGRGINELAERRKGLEEEMKHVSMLKDLIETVGLDNYAELETRLNVESQMRIVEHVRNELEIYRVGSSTMTSALIGAIIGSILTLGVAYFLGSIGV